MANNGKASGGCFVDGKKNISDSHHIIPIEYDGKKDGRQVPLCPTCHRNVHREAENVYKTGKWGTYINTNSYPDVESLKRAQMLARYILEAKTRFLASGKSKGDESRNMMQIGLTNDELQIVHALKRQMGFKNLPALVKHLVLSKWEELNRKGGR